MENSKQQPNVIQVNFYPEGPKEQESTLKQQLYYAQRRCNVAESSAQLWYYMSLDDGKRILDDQTDPAVVAKYEGLYTYLCNEYLKNIFNGNNFAGYQKELHQYARDATQSFNGNLLFQVFWHITYAAIVELYECEEGDKLTEKQVEFIEIIKNYLRNAKKHAESLSSESDKDVTFLRALHKTPQISNVYRQEVLCHVTEVCCIPQTQQQQNQQQQNQQQQNQQQIQQQQFQNKEQQQFQNKEQQKKLDKQQQQSLGKF